MTIVGLIVFTFNKGIICAYVVHTENYLTRKAHKMILELLQRNCIREYIYNVYYIYLKCRKKLHTAGIVAQNEVPKRQM